MPINLRDPEKRNPRIKVVYLDRESVARLLMGGTSWRVISGLPKDARLVQANCGYSSAPYDYTLVFESQSFDEVAPGMIAEVMSIEIERLLDREEERPVVRTLKI